MPGNEEKLIKMLKYVSERNDFYKKRIKEYGISNPLDITQWPILTRKELQENRYNMFSDGYEEQYYRHKLIRKSTSGSSGLPVNVYWDELNYYASNMSLWRKRAAWYDIYPSDRCVSFTLNSFNSTNITNYKREKTIGNRLIINASLIQNDNDIIEIIKCIQKFCPKWVVSIVLCK